MDMSILRLYFHMHDQCTKDIHAALDQSKFDNDDLTLHWKLLNLVQTIHYRIHTPYQFLHY